MPRKPNRPVPCDQPGDCLQFTISDKYSVDDLTKIIGFPPNIKDDPDKVKYSWGFKYRGKRFGVWDYRGERWSVYGPQDLFNELLTGI